MVVGRLAYFSSIIISWAAWKERLCNDTERKAQILHAYQLTPITKRLPIKQQIDALVILETLYISSPLLNGQYNYHVVLPERWLLSVPSARSRTINKYLPLFTVCVIGFLQRYRHARHIINKVWLCVCALILKTHTSVFRTTPGDGQEHI